MGLHLITLAIRTVGAVAILLPLALLADLFFPNAKAYLVRQAATLKCKVVHFTRRHGGASIVVAGLAGWFAYGPILHLFTGDGPDGPALMDAGVFQTILLAIVRAVALYCFARLLVKKYVTPVGRFLFTNRFVWSFYRLSGWQKIITSLWVLSLFVFLVTQLTR